MAARLQIVVDVDDSAFKEYTRHFKEYSQALKGAPEQWRKVAAASRAAANDSEKAEKSIASYSDSVEKSASFGTKLRQQTEITARTFHQLTLNTQKMAVHIGDATKALLTWSGIMGVVGGIASYATIQGFSNLASSASSQRMGGMSLGTNVGKVNAFKLNFERLGVDGFLEGLATNRTTPEGRSGLYGLGFGDKDLSLETPDLGNRLLGRLKKFVDSQDESSLSTQLKARRLDQYISPEQALRLKHMSKEEFQGLQRSYKKDAKSLAVEDKEMKSWQELMTAIDKTKSEIEKAFLVTLEPVAKIFSKTLDALQPSLEDLKTTQAYLDEEDAKLRAAFKGFNEAVGTAKKFLGGLMDKMRAAVKWFTDKIQWLKDKFPWFFRGGNAGEDASPGGGGFGAAAERMKRLHELEDRQDTANNPPGFNEAVKKFRAAKYAGSSKGGLKGIIDRAAAEEGIDPRIMYGIVAGESAHEDIYDIGDHGKSHGPFQMYTGGGLGNKIAESGIDVNDPKTIPAQAKWIARFLKHGGSLSNWHGYHGNRNWDPSWGRMGVVGDDKAANNIKPKDPSHGRGALGRRRHEELMGNEGHRGGDAIMGSAHVQVDVHPAPGSDYAAHAAAMAGNGQ